MAGLALVWRRRYPLTVLAVTLAATAVYAGAGFVDGAPLVAVLVSLYTVASLVPWPVAVGAGAVSLAVSWLAAGFGGPFGWLGGPNSVRWAVVIAAVAIGMVRGNQRQLLVARAERAEQAWEEEARRRVDAERLRIARELHDVVAHSMSMINVQAGMAAHVLESQPEQAASALQSIKTASKEGLAELRTILNVLRQVDEAEATAPAPGLDGLRSLVATAERAGLATTFSLAGAARPVPATVELATYRIVQEALTNVLRHARAEHAAVTVGYEPDGLVVRVDDDGRAGGAGPGPAPGNAWGSGTGITGMRERAEVFGGTVEAGRRPGGGWRVEARLPTGERTPAPPAPTVARP